MVVLSSLTSVRRHLPRHLWYVVHLTSMGALVMTLLHAVQAGSDSGAVSFTTLIAVLAGVAMYPTALRLIGILSGPKPRAPRS